MQPSDLQAYLGNLRHGRLQAQNHAALVRNPQFSNGKRDEKDEIESLLAIARATGRRQTRRERNLRVVGR